MSSKPILFSTPMVQAILEGRKTQTRRIVKQKLIDSCMFDTTLNTPENLLPRYCPYGKLGDLLWVRETFVLENNYEYYSKYKLPTDRPLQHHDGFDLIPHYKATEPEPRIVDEDLMNDKWDDRTRWKPSIFMPRWASRITLEITDIRVERLQDISEEDAAAEGCRPYFDKENPVKVEGCSMPMQPLVTPKESFQKLWQSINGNWKNNPFVWVIEFKVHNKNVDEVLNEQ